MKRLISAEASIVKQATRDELFEMIRLSEGRCILSENIVEAMPILYDVSNSEIAKAMGADMILLNFYDLDKNFVAGLPKTDNPIALIKDYTGLPVGINLEPVDFSLELKEERTSIATGRQATKENFIKANKLGVDYICLTGNPQVGVSNHSILAAIKLCKENFNGLIIAGKMHSSGISENLLDEELLGSYMDAGADIILLPSLNTIPGISEDSLRKAVSFIHSKGKLALGAIGTSQEGSDEHTIREIGLSNKRIGFDISHIGDTGYFGIAIPENIMALSIAIKGRRHTYRRMGLSVKR